MTDRSRLISILILVMAGASSAYAERWSFEGCRAYVGRITVSDKGAGVDDEPKLEARPAFSASVEREKTPDAAGRRVILSVDGETFSLDAAKPSRAQRGESSWERFDDQSQAWVIYSERGAEAVIEIQRKAVKGGKIAGTATDVGLVRKLSSDGQYVEQAFASDPRGEIVYQNGTACGQAFGDEPSITLKDAGEKARDLKFGLRTY